jgi:hypothetical protein
MSAAGPITFVAVCVLLRSPARPVCAPHDVRAVCPIKAFSDRRHYGCDDFVGDGASAPYTNFAESARKFMASGR